jgi:hypothetical protein
MTAARPPRHWEVQTTAVLATIAAAALLTAVGIATDLGVRSYALGDTGEVSALLSWVLRNAETVQFFSLVIVFAYLGTFWWWRRRTAAIVRRIDASPGVTSHWGIRAWSVCLFGSFFLMLTNNSARHVVDRESLATMLGWTAAIGTIRLAGLALLVFAVWQVRGQVRRAVAESGLVFRVGDLGAPGTRPVQARPLPSMTVVDMRPDLPTADDEFWTRVGALAAETGSDLALLETTEGVARRWALIQPGNIAMVRGSVPPGAVVTVYAEPPAASSAEGFAPAEADEYHGFLEDGATGSLWYQSVRPNRVAAFLARARSARRWALYPAESPTALSAVVRTTTPATFTGA